MPAKKNPRIEKLLESLREDLGSEAFEVHDREPLDPDSIELFRPSDHAFGVDVSTSPAHDTFDLGVTTPGDDPKSLRVRRVPYEEVRETVRRVCGW